MCRCDVRIDTPFIQFIYRGAGTSYIQVISVSAFAVLRAFYDVMMASFVPVNATPKHQNAKDDQDYQTRICADLHQVYSLTTDVLSGPKNQHFY